MSLTGNPLNAAEPPPSGASSDKNKQPLLDRNSGNNQGQAQRDPLVELVAALSRHFGKPRSADSLASGLPLINGRIPESSLVRIAYRANLSCKEINHGIAAFDELSLPALLILKDNTACVLLKKVIARRGRPNDPIGASEARATRWRIITPNTGGVTEITQEALERLYDSRAYIMQPDALTESPAVLTSSFAGHWLWEAFKPNAWIYGQAALGTVLVNCLALCLPIFIMVVYDRIVPNHAVESLTVLSLGMLIVALADFAIRTLRAHMTDIAGRRMDVVLGNRVFDQVLQVKMSERKGSSGVTANTIRELDVLKEFLNSTTLAILGDLPFLLLFILMMAWISGPLAWVPVIAIPITLAICCLTQLPLHTIMEKAFKNASQRNAVLFEVLNGMETIKSNGAESWAADQWERAHAASVKSSFASRSFNLFNSHFLIFSQAISTLLIIILGVNAINDGALSFGALFAAVMLNSRAMAPLNQVAATVGKLHSVIIAYAAIDKVMHSQVERDDNVRCVHLPHIKGTIEFQDVDFAYPIISMQGQQDAPTVNALNKTSFSIQPGEHVAIIGAIGSGKTTVLKLLLNLYQPQSGAVRLDELDITQIDPTDLRHQMGYVPQNPYFFQGTVRQNITFHQMNASDEAVLSAAQKAGVLNWLKSCPLGLSQPIGGRGDALSGGQRQSLALARALLKDPKVMLLDEPTSLLDNRSEAIFVQQLMSLPKDKTLIVVTHRPALLAAVDRIIVMDGGRVVLDGEKSAVLQQLKQAGENRD